MTEQIIKIVADILEVEVNTLSLETKQEDLEAWDSLAHIRIIAEIEEELGKAIPIDEVIEITTIDQLVQAVEQA